MDAAYQPMAPYPRQSKQPIVLTALATLALALLVWAAFLRPDAPPPAAPFPTKAVVVLTGDSPAHGTVTFTQAAPTAPVAVSGTLRGLDPSALRGFHIHAAGDLSNGCLSAGAHFNPAGLPHGARNASARHAGDLGNVASDAQGVAALAFADAGFSLGGPHGVVGRAVVLHAGTDDLGMGGNEESLKTGNAGARAACGVIGLAD